MAKLGSIMMTASVHIEAADQLFDMEIYEILHSKDMKKQMEVCVAKLLNIKGTNGSLDELDNAAKLLGEPAESVKFGDKVIVFCQEQSNEEPKDINLCAGVLIGLIEKYKEEKEKNKLRKSNSELVTTT